MIGLAFLCAGTMIVGLIVNIVILLWRNDDLANEVNRLTMELERK